MASWTITIHGNHDGEHDELKATEEDIAARAKEFTKSLPGVTSASATFGTLGGMDLTPEGSQPVAPV